MPGFRIQIHPVDAGSTSAQSTLKKSVAVQSGSQHAVNLVASEAQIQGVFNYLKLIKAGDVTTTVETAVTALTP